MVKYEWDESNGVSVPTNKLMTIDSDEYYVGMPLKKLNAETVAPTDGDPEYICLAQRNAGDEIRPLQIPVQEVLPDAVYTKILEDGTEEKVKFGGGGGGAILDSNGKLKSEVLPDGYPYDYIDYKEALTWNGQPPEVYVEPNNEYYETYITYCLVHSDCPSKEDAVGGFYTVYCDDDGTTTDHTITSVTTAENVTDIDGWIYIIYKDNTTYKGATYPKKGVYFAYDWNLYSWVTNFSISSSSDFRFSIEATKRFDLKYIQPVVYDFYIDFDDDNMPIPQISATFEKVMGDIKNGHLVFLRGGPYAHVFANTGWQSNEIEFIEAAGNANGTGFIRRIYMYDDGTNEYHVGAHASLTLQVKGNREKYFDIVVDNNGNITATEHTYRPLL